MMKYKFYCWTGTSRQQSAGCHVFYCEPSGESVCNLFAQLGDFQEYKTVAFLVLRATAAEIWAYSNRRWAFQRKVSARISLLSRYTRTCPSRSVADITLKNYSFKWWDMIVINDTNRVEFYESPSIFMPVWPAANWTCSLIPWNMSNSPLYICMYVCINKLSY